MRIMRRWSIATVVVVVTLAGGVFIARPFVHGLSFVIRAAEMDGTLRRVADLDASAEREREIAIPTPGGSMRGRVYEPTGTPHRAALLVSGLHPSGIDEPRLMRLARQLAADHLVVVTPDIPELSRFEITPAITDTIERTAGWGSASAAAFRSSPPDGHRSPNASRMCSRSAVTTICRACCVICARDRSRIRRISSESGPSTELRAAVILSTGG
ncbi:MAG: hypothetical protein DMG01_13255 [Acidobacteria bacterium]|nr:MAG: hypothetical protein DMG01_13255 [Acidobacteriota bacterium]